MLSSAGRSPWVLWSAGLSSDGRYLQLTMPTPSLASRSLLIVWISETWLNTVVESHQKTTFSIFVIISATSVSAKRAAMRAPWAQVCRYTLLSKAQLSLSLQRACTPDNRFLFKLSSQVGTRAIVVLTSIKEHVQRGFSDNFVEIHERSWNLHLIQCFSFLAPFTPLLRSASFSSTSHPYFIRLRLCRMILLWLRTGGGILANPKLRTLDLRLPSW